MIMAEEPTERTYAAELAKAIAIIGESLGFDAEVEKKTPSGYPDVVIYYKGEPVAVIEIKKPEVSLGDPKLNEQALRYAEWYRRNKGVKLYGIHNMRYLKLFKYVTKQEKQVTLLDYINETVSGWVPVSDFPFKIMPWVTSIEEYKHITTHAEAKRNLEKFLLSLKEILEGKTLDLSKEVIDTLRTLIEKAASNGVAQFEYVYNRDAKVKELVNRWFGERGFEKPKNTNEFRNFLKLLLKEQIYTFTMKLLFYLVLQSIDADMAAKLQESIKPIEDAKDPGFFKKIADTLFAYAIERTGDFEEIFGINTVDRLPFMSASLPQLKEIVRYLNQIKWSDISIDVIGKIFEGLIYEERRHLLGQHYTDTKIVDLILAGVFKEHGKPDKLLDPACGSGTFLVRALNYWKIMYSTELDRLKMPIYEYVEGVDIDRLASMLAKINLYIQALEKIKAGYKYIPKIHHHDFFKINLSSDYAYVVTNPPYTKQVEMALAFYDKQYKENLLNHVKDIENWDERASIYAYFLVRGGKLLRENGRLGFIVENSWLNAEYGIPLKKWLFKNFTVEYVIESLVERWFEDAAVITNIIIAEKTVRSNYDVRFVFLKKKLNELIGAPPPANDFIANEQYYRKIMELYHGFDSCKPAENSELMICENEGYRVVTVKRNFIEKIEAKIGRLGVLRGPKLYLKLIENLVNSEDSRLILLGEIIDVRRGLTTNADDIFYLPSKYWEYVRETQTDLVIRKNIPPVTTLTISKKYLRRLITPRHVESSTYEIKSLPTLRRDDYVIWVDDVNNVTDEGMKEYLAWVENFVKEEYETSNGRKFSALYNKIVKHSNWTKLADTSGGLLIFRKGIHRNYGVLLNRTVDTQFHQRLYIGYAKESVSPEVLFAVVNSVITYMGMELIGQTSLGEGVLDIKTADYERIPIVNPIWLEKHLRMTGKYSEFLGTVNKLLNLRPTDIEIEAKKPERLEMEKFVLGSLGFSEDNIKDLYRELIELVKFRTERAKSVRQGYL